MTQKRISRFPLNEKFSGLSGLVPNYADFRQVVGIPVCTVPVCDRIALRRYDRRKYITAIFVRSEHVWFSTLQIEKTRHGSLQIILQIQLNIMMCNTLREKLIYILKNFR